MASSRQRAVFSEAESGNLPPRATGGILIQGAYGHNAATDTKKAPEDPAPASHL